MKDIAQDLGVSVVTVSKVLRNHSDISAETRMRVLKRIKELNYRPNLAARALVTGRTNMIGLVVPDLMHSFFSEVSKGITRVLRKRGYGLVISSSEQNPAVEEQAIEQLIARRVDALIIASTQWTAESFRKIEEQRIPYILIDRKFAGLAANVVGTDDELAGRLATEHLVQVGCKRIAHISGVKISTALGRLEGYRQTLAKHRMTLGKDYTVFVENMDDSAQIAGYEAAKKLLELNPRPDGIFCFNDPIAMGAMKAIIEADIRIPEDIALAGCGNIHYNEYLRVPLTSVDQQSIEIGERSARLALSIVQSKNPARPKVITLEPRLIVRASTMRQS